MDKQYKFLKIVCRLSRGEQWVSYKDVKKKWRKCPPEHVLLNLANHTYVECDGGISNLKFFPNPEAFSYVRQRRDSIRNLFVTSATLLVAVWTLFTTLLQV